MYRPIPRRSELLAAVVLVFSGCGRAPAQAPGPEATLVVSVAAQGAPIATLVVEVTAADIPSPLIFNVSLVNGVGARTIKVPVGLARTLTAQAMDASGTITHDGSVTVDVVQGSNPPVAIALTPRPGHVPITVDVGPVTVVVIPAQATVTVGATRQLTATVTDASGTVVPLAVEWASANPAVVTVDANGLVTALIAGTADVVATCAGAAGTSQITATAP